jgi:hypothetical protein
MTANTYIYVSQTRHPQVWWVSKEIVCCSFEHITIRAAGKQWQTQVPLIAHVFSGKMDGNLHEHKFHFGRQCSAMIQRRGPEKNKPNASTRREVRCNGGLVSRLHPGCARCRDHVMAQSLRQSGPGNASARSNSSLATDLSMVGLTGADQRWMVAHVNQRFF